MTHGQSDTIPGQRPIVVAGAEPITPLAAALAALNADITSKPLYLEAAPHAALRDYVAELEEITEAAARLVFEYWCSYSKNESALMELLTVHSGILSEMDK